MARSKYKGPYVASSLVKKITKLRKEGDISKTSVKTYSRRSTILPSFVGITFEVYNGNKFIRFYTTEYMIGKKLGEFSITRTFVKHSGDKVRNFVK